MLKKVIAAALTVAALGVAIPSYSATIIVRKAPPPPRECPRSLWPLVRQKACARAVSPRAGIPKPVYVQ